MLQRAPAGRAELVSMPLKEQTRSHTQYSAIRLQSERKKKKFDCMRSAVLDTSSETAPRQAELLLKSQSLLLSLLLKQISQSVCVCADFWFENRR